MADNRIDIEIVLEDGSVLKGFSKIEKEADSTAINVGKSFLKNFALIGAAAAAAATAVAGIFAKKSIDAAKAYEEVVNDFNVALALSGKFTKEAADNFRDFASSIQETTKFSDDQVLATATLIQNLGNLPVDTLQDATKATLDLATALRIDLNTAAVLVGKAASGNVESFSRYGLAIQKGKDNAETFSNTLQALSRFQGASEQSSNTLAGAQVKLANSIDDVFKEFGRIVTKSPAIIATINTISGAFSNTTKSLSVSIGNQDVFKDLIINFSIVAQAGIATANQLTAAFGVFFRGIQVAGQVLVNIFTLASKSATDNLGFFLDKFNENLEQFKNPDQNPMIEFFDKLIERVQSTSGTMNSFTEGIKNTIGPATQVAADNLESLRATITKTYQQGILNVISAGAQSIGASLVKGSNAFKDFGKIVLGIIGDMAIQIGTTLVSIGLGIDALKTALSTLSGGVAIAAGLALIAVGGLLKSLSGGGGISVSPGTPGGSPSSPVPVTEIPQSDIENEDVERGPRVVVNVEGQILDPVGTATRIAELLAEVTSSNDITVRA